MKKVIFLFVCIFSFAQKKHTNHQHDIIGLTSLIQLSVEPTEVILEDYFTDSKGVTVYKVPKGLNHSIKSGILTLNGKMENPVDVLLFSKNGVNYSVPIRNTLQEKYDFTFKSKKEYQNLKIKGNFNGWDINKNKLNFQNGVYSFTTFLNPGRYEYVFVENEKEFPDPSNSKSISNGIGGINSVFEVGDLNKEKLFIYTKKYQKKQIIIEAKKALKYVALLDNQLIDQNLLKVIKNQLILTLPSNLNDAGRCHLRIYAHDGKDVANDILIPLKNGIPILSVKDLNKKDKQTMTIYSLMIDRFFDGKKENNKPLNQPDVLPMNDFQGGDFVGITQKIKSNFFEDLGVNTLWVSPISENPKTAFGNFDKGGIKSKFSGYHGYWPISSSKIDERFGNDAEFTDLINVAHTNKMSVLLDYVAHHVHQDHPAIKNNPTWQTDIKTPDGRENVALWDEFRLTTWFDPFLPTFKLEDEKITNIMTDSAVYWIKKFPLDGFRHDATKHIPNNFWRTLTKKIKTEITIPENRPIYQIGETYGGHNLIASYINNGLLDAQFEFSIYHHVTHSLINPKVSLNNLATALDESLYYYGSHHLMGNISGNHDKARIVSYADGSVKFEEDAKLAGYTRKIENNGQKGFDVVSQIIAFNNFIPGIPVLYYGDEIGMPGGNDPDCRRMMEFENLNSQQQNLRNSVKKMLDFRKNRMSLLYGDTKIIAVNEDILMILRTYFGESSVFILNKSAKSQTISTDKFKEFLPKYKIYNPTNENKLDISANSFLMLYN